MAKRGRIHCKWHRKHGRKFCMCRRTGCKTGLFAKAYRCSRGK